MALRTYLSGIKTIYLKVTNDCNLNCSFCYNKGKHTVPTFKLPKGALDEFKGLLIFHGGEPMLNTKYIDSIYDEYKDRGFKFSITTNLLTNFDTLLRYAKEWENCDYIKVSYDVFGRFPNAEVEERFMSNLKKLYLSTDKDVIVSICLSEHTLSIDPKKIYDKFKRISDGLNFELLTNDSEEDISDLIPKYSEVDEWLLSLYRIYRDNNKSFYISNFDDLEKASTGIYVGCRARQCSYTVRTIETDGRMFGCPNTVFKDTGVLANICDDFVILEKKNIISSNKQETTKENKATCLYCKYNKICNFGGCYQQKWTDTCPGLKKLMQEISNDMGVHL